MSIAQDPPDNTRDVLARWGMYWATAWYNDECQEWRVYQNPEIARFRPAAHAPDAWRELPPAQQPADDLVARVAELERREAMLSVHVARLSAASEAHDEALKLLTTIEQRVAARFDALEARAATDPTPPDVVTPEQRDAVNAWYYATRPRRMEFEGDGWFLADPETGFAATGPETGDAAYRAAYDVLEKAGQI